MRRDTSTPSTVITTTTAATTPTLTTTTTTRNPGASSLPSPPATSKTQTTSLSKALRKLTAGPSQAEFLKGPVSEGFPPTSLDPTTRWIGPGATTVETPPTGTRGGLFSTATTTTTTRGDDYYFTYDTPRDKGSTRHHPRRRLSKRDSIAFPPLSDGVPSRGLFSKTKGHSHYYYTSERAVVFPNDKDKKMSERPGNSATTAPVVDKETNVDHLDETSSTEVGTVTKRHRVKRHCAKWWWVHLLIFIALVVLIVCLM